MWLISILFIFSFANAVSPYVTSKDQLCDGYPQVQVGSFQGSCVGLVASDELKSVSGKSLSFPRKIIEWKSNQFLISDMGSWDPYRGKIWLLDVSDKQNPKLKLLLDRLVLPHGLAVGPDGWVYVGEMGLIFKFNPEVSDIASSCKIVIGGLQSTVPRTSGNPCKDEKIFKPNGVIKHPLVNFIFSKNKDSLWNLIVNSGSVTEHCESKIDSNGICTDDSGYVKEYVYVGSSQSTNENETGNGSAVWSQEGYNFAAGLRNSMGLVSHRSGTLIQLENSRDFKEAEEPHEELNVLIRGKHYGWPYCYNFYGRSPEWINSNVFPCDETNLSYQVPYTLLPAHVAPLDAIYYEGELFPELQNQLLVSFHGYREPGQKIVAYPVDNVGVPLLSENINTFSFFDVNLNKLVNKKFAPAGGLVQHANYQELLFNWNMVRGRRPKGAPVGLAIASDGSIWIVEDKNKSILRVSKGASFLEDGSFAEPPKELKLTLENLKTWNFLSREIFTQRCATCHVQFQNPKAEETLKLLVKAGWITPGSRESLLIQRVQGIGGAKMPIGGSLTNEQIHAIEQFILEIH